MNTNNKHMNLDSLQLSTAIIAKLQSDFSQKDYETFENEIKVPLKNMLTDWMNKLYPQLMNDSCHVSRGVFRRIKNDIKKLDKNISSYPLGSKAEKYFNTECESILPTQKNLQNNLGLTKTEFDELVIRLKDGDETLIEKIYLSHLKKSVAIITKQTNCQIEVAYSSTIEALIEIRSDLIKNRLSYGNLQSYFTTRGLKKFYKSQSKKRIIETNLSEDMEFRDDTKLEDSIVERDLNDLIKKSIEKLGIECQSILKLHYYQNKKMAQIGKELNKSHDAVRKQASRCRDTLKRILGGKFYRQFSSHFS